MRYLVFLQATGIFGPPFSSPSFSSSVFSSPAIWIFSFHFPVLHFQWSQINYNKKDGYHQQNVRQLQKLISIRGLSRSLKLMPFKSLGAVSYSPSILPMAVSAAILEIFNVKEWPDLEIWVWGPSRSLKLMPFKSLGVVSYSPSIATMALSCIVCEI